MTIRFRIRNSAVITGKPTDFLTDRGRNSVFEDANCSCCGVRFRRDESDYGTVDYTMCEDCADNSIYGVECDHDTLLNDNDWWSKHGHNEG